MRGARTDRIFHLKDLNDYPESESLDMAFWLPAVANTTRRVWLMAPESSPALSIDDVTITPRQVSEGPPRWLDYGTAELPCRFIGP